ARTKQRVLLIDTDPQGHVAVALGMDKAPGIRSLIDRAAQDNPASLPIVITPARENLDTILSDATTRHAKRTLAAMDFRETVLKKTIAEVGHLYDIAVIDCAPSADVLHISALVAATDIIIPTRLDHLAVDGVNEVLRTIVAIRDSLGGTGLNVRGIVPTFYERRTKETPLQLKALVEAFERLVMPPIPTDVKLRECPAFGQPIWEYAATTNAIVGVPVNSANPKGKRFGGYIALAELVEDWLR
ncbi:MAG: ParA family protein, partial [Propionibacteriaceae bacterium]|nr:ParA family protein [Propionibacteriaceae bacterium]